MENIEKFTRILLLAITTVLYCAEIKCLLPLNKKPTELIFVADFVKSITEVHVFLKPFLTLFEPLYALTQWEK